MTVRCNECDVEAVQSDKATFNVVYECPECGTQIACDVAKE
jgi:ribosomal protein S27E